MLLLPQRRTGGPGVDLRGRRRLEGLEVEVQPHVGRRRVELLPRPQLDHPLTPQQPADQVLVVPARENDQFARAVVHARAHDRRIPLPAILAYDGRVGLHRVLVEVVEDEAIDPVARERTLAPDGEQPAPAADDLHLVGRADVVGRPGPALDRGGGKVRGVLLRVEDALHAAVKLRGERRGVGGDGHAQVGIEAQQVGGEERGSSRALAVLGRHGDDEPPDAARGERLQHAVVGPVEGPQLQEGIDLAGEVGQRGHAVSRTHSRAAR